MASLSRVADAEEGRAMLPEIMVLLPAIEAAAVPSGIAALTGEIMAVNDLFCDLLGQPPHDLIGAHSRQYMHPEDLELADSSGTLPVGFTDTAAKRFVRPDGSIVHTLRFLRPIADASGQPIALMFTVIDVTDRWAAERGLAELGRAALEGTSGSALRVHAERLVADALGTHQDVAGAVITRLLTGSDPGYSLGDSTGLVTGAVNVLASAAQRRARRMPSAPRPCTTR
jgi:PAS domain S-box-containing protein